MGKTRYTFSELFSKEIEISENESSCKINKVIIPRIQRPYVQGRIGERETRIRENFLQVIFDKGFNKNQIVDLNFMYGSVVKDEELNTLELLDGQQRFTTLFLLHWYLLCLEGENRVNYPDYCEALKHFTYETRTTTKDFCEDLSHNFLSLRKGDKPSLLVTNARWYHHTYDKDSSIQAMLVMVDTIHTKYCAFLENNEIQNSISYISRLDNLKFYVLPLPDYDMSEDLYMKMNARGLQLSAFDNFKSQLMGKLEKSEIADITREYGGRTLKFKEAFGIKLDTIWADFFWSQHNNDKYDHVFMRFFSRFFAARDLLSGRLAEAKSFRDDQMFAFFYDKSEKTTDYLGFEQYEFALEDETLFLEIESVLDILKDNSDCIAKYLSPVWETKKAENYFCSDDTKFGHQEMVIFCSIIDYIIERKKNCPENESAFDKSEFNSYMRVVWNIVGNSDIDNKERLAVVARAIHKLMDAVKNTEVPFYEAFALLEAEDDFNTINETTKRLFWTEHEKSKRIVNDQSWLELFIKTEQHPFITGDITSFYSPDKEIFSHRLEMVCLMFDDKGITPTFRKDHLLIRALFTSFTTWNELKNQAIIESVESHNYLKLLFTNSKNRVCQTMLKEILDECPTIETLLEKLAEKTCISLTNKNEDGQPLRNEEYRLYYLRKSLAEDTKMFDWFSKLNKPVQLREYHSHYAIGITNTYYDRIIPDSDRNYMAKRLAQDLEMQLDYKEDKIREYANSYGDEHNFFGSICCRKEIHSISMKADFDSTFRVILYSTNKSLLESLQLGGIIRENEEHTSFYMICSDISYANKAFYEDEILNPTRELFQKIELTISNN